MSQCFSCFLLCRSIFLPQKDTRTKYKIYTWTELRIAFKGRSRDWSSLNYICVCYVDQETTWLSERTLTCHYTSKTSQCCDVQQCTNSNMNISVFIFVLLDLFCLCIGFMIVVSVFATFYQTYVITECFNIWAVVTHLIILFCALQMDGYVSLFVCLFWCIIMLWQEWCLHLFGCSLGMHVVHRLTMVSLTA